jgi:hypothetical protein
MLHACQMLYSIMIIHRAFYWNLIPLNFYISIIELFLFPWWKWVCCNHIFTPATVLLPFIHSNLAQIAGISCRSIQLQFSVKHNLLKVLVNLCSGCRNKGSEDFCYEQYSSMHLLSIVVINSSLPLFVCFSRTLVDTTMGRWDCSLRCYHVHIR